MSHVSRRGGHEENPIGGVHKSPTFRWGRQGLQSSRNAYRLKDLLAYRVAETVACWPFRSHGKEICVVVITFATDHLGLLCCIRSQQTGGRCPSYDLGKSSRFRQHVSSFKE
ncbi:hypothetical protein TNCT_722901 [Trichonephila clavata]|uniref:Uncharacterized protein n=1 Tax=Trichonephila clavata TaxID=2740835 RepID=A0A8X6LST6_TRICU|nr:hypothetical protein TNCT_722901 [Trichonephila clavata]